MCAGSYIGDIYTGNCYPPLTGRSIPPPIPSGGSVHGIQPPTRRTAPPTSRIQRP